VMPRESQPSSNAFEGRIALYRLRSTQDIGSPALATRVKQTRPPCWAAVSKDGQGLRPGQAAILRGVRAK
jgi:hypothetical protein